MGKVLQLSKGYPSIFGQPSLRAIDERVFTLHYRNDCMQSHCNDMCCAHGVDIDAANLQRLDECREALEKHLGFSLERAISPARTADDDFPGGTYARTLADARGCLFLNKTGRGCLIHDFCLANGIDFHTLKPLVSCLFPLTFDKGRLEAAAEIAESALACCGSGTTLYRGMRAELDYFFGHEFVQEADDLERDYAGF